MGPGRATVLVAPGRRLRGAVGAWQGDFSLRYSVPRLRAAHCLGRVKRLLRRRR